MDFSTATRGGPFRGNENQISMRVNLIKSEERDLTSADITLRLRPIITQFLAKYPGVKLRLLEDPAGPPVSSTFLLKISGKSGENPENVENLTSWISQKITPILEKQKVLDVYNSLETYRNKYRVRLDYELITRLGLSSDTIVKSIYSIFNGSVVGIFNDETSKYPKNIFIKVSDAEKNSAKTLDRITFTSNTGRKILLSEIAKVEISSDDSPIVNDERLPTSTIYGEMGDNSVMYPMVNLIKRFLSDEFWEGKYEVTSWNPYAFQIREKATGKDFSIRLAGEWEMTMDSFRDLAVALGGALSLLFFLVAANFRSFRMG